jgi:hypothetical protein
LTSSSELAAVGSESDFHGQGAVVRVIRVGGWKHAFIAPLCHQAAILPQFGLRLPIIEEKGLVAIGIGGE